eukprot:TRINITY_DN1940_c0_g1_i4.p1 TRINITY_DN1940_c0_g1~~TRINITY_DN1940_c0_g1_i4.p1  ORF type:complete len:752 (+),score=190.49 TRINITY_DN1940_c0_g1_i4:106-2256(+)
MPDALRRTKQLNIASLTPAAISAYFDNVYTTYEWLMSSLSSDEVYYEFPNRLRRPLIFYLGHTAVFYINKLCSAGVLTEEQRPNPHYEDIFAVGVDEMSWDDMADDHFEWPPVADVWKYRRAVKALVLEAIPALDWSAPVTRDMHKQWSVLMSIEHENIHLETSSVLIRELPVEKTRAPDGWAVAPSFGMPPKNKFVHMHGGTVRMGKPSDVVLSPAYGWDCEFGDETHQVGEFEVTQFKVSNAEWLAFVNDKGYEKQELWSEEGWRWCTFSKARHPHFWVPLDASKYRFRTMFEEIDMPWDWPVEVNHLEAYAYCQWRGDGFRLITEPEWRLIAGFPDSYAKDVAARDPGFGSKPTDLSSGYNKDLLFGSSTPVNFFKPNEQGIYDAFGNVWELSSSEYRGLAGFQEHSLYMDFSTPCFDGKHDLILGGSWISTGNESSVHARYGFRRHFFQHAGFRVVRPIHKENVYETEESLHQYIHFHYGKPADLLPWEFGPTAALEFPKRCAELCIQHASAPEVEAALDIGCAVGRSTFELARAARFAKGIDYSHAFADFANSLRDKREVSYKYTFQGDLKKTGTAAVPSDIDCSRVEFAQGDAHLLDTDRQYDMVLGANLIDRLHSPMQFVRSVHEVVKQGGVLVLTSPYTWLEEFTPKKNWLGGYVDAEGNEVTTFDTLKVELGKHFDLVTDVPLPFLIYEHARKFQWSVAHATVWRRR